MKEKRLTDPVPIRINRATRERLGGLGTHDEIFDEILNKLIDFWNKEKLKQANKGK